MRRPQEHTFRPYLALVKTQTDTSHVQLVEHTCDCGNVFKATEQTEQQWCSNSCAEIRGVKGNHRSSKWKSQNNYYLTAGL